MIKPGDIVTYKNSHGTIYPGNRVLKVDSKEAILDFGIDRNGAVLLAAIRREARPNFVEYTAYDNGQQLLEDDSGLISLTDNEFLAMAPQLRTPERRFLELGVKNPSLFISDGLVGRAGSLTLAVYCGESLVCFNAGEAWAKFFPEAFSAGVFLENFFE